MLGALDPETTIAAIGSPPGPALRGLVRISGPRAWRISLETVGLDPASTPLRGASVIRGQIRLEGVHHPLPASVLLWRGPRSYTGQDVAEVHTLGSPPLLGQVLAVCLARGARHAEPGEFTLRAFLSGRIDLTRAEAVLGVIDARNEAQLDAALRQLAGGLSRPILVLRDRLLDRLAHLEANLDFVDEADVDPIALAAFAEEMTEAADLVEALAQRLMRRERLNQYPKVVLTGPPNAGKSRLFNSLSQGDHAIVSPQAGTTRDYLTALCDCDGLTVELVDTAGSDAPHGSIESQAQCFRHEQLETADLVLLCSSPDTSWLWESAQTPERSVLRVSTKCDLDRPDGEALPAAVATSAATGEGLSALRTAIRATLEAQAADGDLPAGTAARCRDSLSRAGQSLRGAVSATLQGEGEELVAFELREAIDELGKVVGSVVTDDLLDLIFRKFCIGK